eukprot:GHUV01014628.1.p1 GENE.GHUV01014628.1~~GHUV01014628.1.p1  ORF type:complete len:325 (+),score=65.92 GHUV01014628.1:255-1229(+)
MYRHICPVLLLCLATCAAASDRAAKLVKRQHKAKDSVIHFSNQDFEEFAVGKGRDYHLVFFLNANYLAGNAKMNLPKLKQEFGLAAKAFRRGPDANKVFFVELVYERSKDVFQRLGVTQLPYIFNWGPDATAKEGRGIKLSKSVECGPDITTYPWPAEDLIRCVSSSSGKAAGEVDRPSIVKNPLFPIGLLAFICVGGYTAWVVYNSPIVRITWLWALGALAVFWFATSGGMYNIIRGMPLYYTGPNGKLVWWMEVSGGVCSFAGLDTKLSAHIVYLDSMSSIPVSWPSKNEELTSTSLPALVVVGYQWQASCTDSPMPVIGHL